MAFPNHFSQEMALQHFSDHHLGDNSSVLPTILPQHLPHSSPDGKTPDAQLHAPPPPPTWLNSAILRQQAQYSGPTAPGATGGDANFLNLHTNSDSSAAASQASNQWLSRSILQRNVSDVRDDVQVSNDSMIAAAISHESAADLNNNNNNNTNNNNDNTTSNRNNGGELTENEVAGGGGPTAAGGDGAMNWQNARHKAEILSHPLYEQLLSAHVACLRIATPVDQLPRIDAQLAQSQHVVAKYSALTHVNLGDDKELDQFMVPLLSTKYSALEFFM